ncbi:MAG: hypothetical protein IT452_04265 [Planctomycetia bacterium]|nr:hypothetical protein [Planctomycetia bacterium]
MKPNLVNLPVALVRMEFHPFGSTWVLDACPFCSKQHRHGGGGRDDNPRDFLGLRRPLCVPGEVPPDSEFTRGYVLVEAQP